MPRNARFGPSSPLPPVEQTNGVRRIASAQPVVVAARAPRTLVTRLELPPLDDPTPEVGPTPARAVSPLLLERLKRS